MGVEDQEMSGALPVMGGVGAASEEEGVGDDPSGSASSSRT